MDAFARALGCIAAILMAVNSADAQQTLILANGDRLTGALVAIQEGTWVFNHPAGQLKVPAADLARFSAPQPIGIRLTDGTLLAASVTTVGGTLRLSRADGTTRDAAFTDLAAVGDPVDLPSLVPIEIGLFSPITRFWGASVSLGISDKTGNSRSRGVAASLEIERTSPQDRLTFKAGLAREDSRIDDGPFEVTVEKYYGSLRMDVFFTDRLFVFASTAQERDTFQDIDLRSNYNGGFGVQILATNATDLRLYTSGGLRREAFTSGGSATTPVVASGAGFRRVLGPAAFQWTLDWVPSVEDFNDYRLTSEASVTTTVFRGLGFRVASRNELNNSPPAGIRKHDMLITTTLTYSIGR